MISMKNERVRHKSSKQVSSKALKPKLESELTIDPEVRFY